MSEPMNNLKHWIQLSSGTDTVVTAQDRYFARHAYELQELALQRSSCIIAISPEHYDEFLQEINDDMVSQLLQDSQMLH